MFTEEDVQYFLTKRNAGSPPGPLYLDDAIKILIAVSQYYGFDGYLINLEHSMPGYVDGMLSLLSSLKTANCQTLWYDSPFSGGFANRLNQDGYKFLDAANYFQSNYAWYASEGTPKQSYQVIVDNSKSPLAARNRMFMGKYCSNAGQGSPPYEGSDFFSALDTIKSQGNPPDYFTGLNVYYPAWDMYDLRAHNTGHNTDKPPDRDIFHSNDQAFWTGIKESIIFAPDKKVPITAVQCMKTYVEERSVITSLPFVTYFNDGEGDFYNISGVTASDGPWSNLSDQSVLPTYRFFFNYPNSRKNKTAIAHPPSDFVFTGGSCLAVDCDGQSGLEFPLFKTEIVLPAKSQLSFYRKQNTLRLETPILQTSDGNSINLELTKKVDLNNEWKLLVYDVPPQYAGKVVTEISLQLLAAGLGSTSYYLGEFKFLDTTGVPIAPQVFTFNMPVDELDWTAIYKPTSHYRVFGFTGQNQTYLIGIAYNSVYRVRYGINEADHIFNPGVKGFGYYKVQEVDEFGRTVPL